MLSTVVGMLAIVDGHAALVIVGVLALIAAAVIALAAWGMWQSVRLDAATAQLDAAVAGVLAEHGDSMRCGCGHEHDPNEMHVQTGVVHLGPASEDTGPAAPGLPVGTECAQDGTGATCSHTCQTCVLAARRV